ncbi:hypothetical protein ATI02_4323 [Pseudomonas baetica]|uniref:Uncharacterized protein n=1 Tax=Pseudomonas baetica TaxID=674054 RepID=A0ABX4Q3K4_9PSED|nr:hypothetical protein [Pseudomonas baetica]PKA71345.1 hypothetical protein ATI02_4323 [Pseudomonas baetica]PTC19844.1 hypothetical protein C0J26_07555 [Pseudomonas baetica]
MKLTSLIIATTLSYLLVTFYISYNFFPSEYRLSVWLGFIFGAVIVMKVFQMLTDEEVFVRYTYFSSVFAGAGFAVWASVANDYGVMGFAPLAIVFVLKALGFYNGLYEIVTGISFSMFSKRKNIL